MLRNILAVVAGLVAGVVVVSAIELAGWRVFPLPQGVDPMDPEQLKAAIPFLPVGSFIFVIAAHGIGSFAGSAVAISAGRRRARFGWIIGAVFLAMTILNLLMIPSPLWFIAADLATVILAPTAAVKLFARKTAP